MRSRSLRVTERNWRMTDCALLAVTKHQSIQQQSKMPAQHSDNQESGGGEGANFNEKNLSEIKFFN